MRRFLPDTFLSSRRCLQLAAPRWRRVRRRKAGPTSPTPSSTTTRCNGAISRNFYDLFLKNHYPLLKKIEATGRMLSVKIESPAYHTTEDGRWDYRVTIRLQEFDRSDDCQSRRRSIHQAALAGSGRPTKKKSSAGSRFCRPLGPAGHGDYAEITRRTGIGNRSGSVVAVTPLLDQVFGGLRASREIEFEAGFEQPRRGRRGGS